MQALVYTGSQNLEIREVVDPEPGPGEAIVEVKRAGICGTDLLIYAGKFPRSKPPLIPGHEFSGKVVALGPRNGEDTGISVGDKVVIMPLLWCGRCPACQEGFNYLCHTLKLIGVDVDGGMARYVRVPTKNLLKISDKLTYEEAALVEPLAVAVHAVRKSGIRVGDHCLVLGGGPIGVLIGIVAKAAGAAAVFLSELRAQRRKIAEKLGLNVIDPAVCDVIEFVGKATGNRGVDVVYEVTGSAGAVAQALAAVKVRGTVMVVGLPKVEVSVDLRQVNFKEVRLEGSRVYPLRDFEIALSLLEDRCLEVAGVISRQVALNEAAAHFATLLTAPDVLKVLVAP